MQALEIIPGELLQGFERGTARDAGTEIEADIRSRPSGKRTAQNFHAELRECEAGEVSEDVAFFAQLGQNGQRVPRLGDELQPLARLEDGAVGELVEAPPVGGGYVDGIELHSFSASLNQVEMRLAPSSCPGSGDAASRVSTGN